MGIIPRFLEGTAFGVLNDILATYHDDDGHATPNRYEALIHPPARVSRSGENQLREEVYGISAKELGKISMRCESITLPGRGLASTPDTNVHGPQREVVNNVSYTDSITMTFQASSDLKERVFFEKWQYTAFNQQTWNLGYYNDYIGSVEIYLLDKQDKRRYGIKLWECFPKEIGPTDLSYGTNNEIIKLPVTINFRYWTTQDINQQPPSLTDRIGQTIVNTVERNISRAIPAVLRNL